jgi:hypothetical protein
MIQASASFLAQNAKLQLTPIYLIEIAGYSRAFTNLFTGVSGQYDWIESIDDHQITVNDLDGGADLGQLVFHVQDRGGAITADFPGFVFEGKAITLKTGYAGMLQSDFALLFTGKIDTVASDNNNADYAFTCVDNKDILAKVIYTVGDNGKAIDSSNTRTLNAHPLDILISLLENECGLLTTDFNVNKLITYRDGLYAGVQFYFVLDQAPAAKEFIENQILKPLGGYVWVNNKGQLDFNFFRRDNRLPICGGCCLAAFTDSSGVIVGAPFLVSATLSQTLTIQAPPGATLLSFGTNDVGYGDNIGAWGLTVNGTSISVGGTTRPWDPSVNPKYSYGTGGTTASVTTPVTAGTNYTIAYVGGTVQIGVGFPFTDPLGITGATSTINHPGIYAVSIAPPIAAPSVALNDDNLDDQTIPLAEQADLINTLTFRFDKDTSSGSSSGKYMSESDLSYSASVAKYGQFGQQIIEADGVRAGFQGYFVASNTAQLIFTRYGMKNLQFEGVSALWSCCLLEPGDVVTLTSAFVPDRAAGVIGITNKVFEVLDRTWSFESGLVTLKLLDASYLLTIGQYYITPDGIPTWVPATTYQKGHYMYLANNSDQYSDGSTAHPLA